VLLIICGVCLFLFSCALAWLTYQALALNTPEVSVVQQRLQRFQNMGAYEASVNAGKDQARNLEHLFKGSLYANKLWETVLERFTFTKSLKKLLVQSGQKVPVDQFVFQRLLLPLLVALLLGFAFQAPVCLLLSPLVSGVSLGLLILKRKKRMEMLVQQLPDALGVMTSAVRAGHSLQSALTLVVNEMPQPIVGELAQVVTDLNLGLPLKDSLTKLVLNLEELTDYHILATAILIQKETGGNLAEILEKLSTTIRERFKLKRQINALTGQAQATGMILGVAPTAMLLLLTVVFYDYVAPLYETGIGRLAIFFAIALQVIGFFIINRILNIKL
jgi:tight adherence protein B